MIIAIFVVTLWLGFSRFDVRRDLVAVSKKEFERMLKNR